MNTNNAEWFHPWDHTKSFHTSVWEIYDDAIQKYQLYCSRFDKILCRLAWKVVRLHDSTFAFCDGMSNREIHRMICEASRSLNNLSYHSGLPIEI